MQAALEVVEQALDTNDVPVGAIILDESGNIVASGFNRREVDSDPTAHAEIVALREAADIAGNWRLDNHTLVVTLEPCAMCAGAIAQARIKVLVFGAWDEKAGAVGSVWDVLRDPRAPYRVEVIAGVLADECGEVLQKFFTELR